MDLSKIHESKAVRRIVIGLGSLVLVIIVFQAGEFVGYRKAEYANKFGDSFQRNFIGVRRSSSNVLFTDMPGGHGAIGKVVSVSLPTFVVEGPDNIEKIVMIDDDTVFRSFRNEASTTDIAPDQYVVVLGNPDDDGKIDAKLVRLVPPPQGVSTSYATGTPQSN